MLATVARFGEPGWQGYWRRLRANGVLVVDGWEEAYTAPVLRSRRRSKGTRPIVVSYATSPAAEVIFAKKPPATAPTAVVHSQLLPPDRARRACCAGAKHPDGARKLIDFMLSPRFQATVPDTHVRLPRAQGHAAAGRLPQVRRLPRRTRSSSRRRRSARTATAGSTSGPTPSCADARLARRRAFGVPAAFLALFFAYPLAGDPRARLHRPAAGSCLPAGTRRAALVHDLAGGASTAAHARSPGCRSHGSIGRFRFRGRSLVRALVLVPFVLPTVVVATAFLALLPARLRARHLGRSSPRTSSSTSPS